MFHIGCRRDLPSPPRRRSQHVPRHRSRGSADMNGPDMISDALIYIADDEPANRLLLERILAQGGFTRVRSFPDGGSLLTACAEAEPDLVLADLRMPGIDGFGVLESLRGHSDDAYLPVVVLTAEPNRDTRKRALSLGAADVLGKPFDFDEVLLRSRNLIETRLLHAALATRIVTLGDEVEARGRAINDVTSERAAIAASLDRVSAFDTPETIAAALCADLATAIDARHVTLLIFESSQRAVSFVAHNARSKADIGYALPLERSSGNAYPMSALERALWATNETALCDDSKISNVTWRASIAVARSAHSAAAIVSGVSNADTRSSDAAIAARSLVTSLMARPRASTSSPRVTIRVASAAWRSRVSMRLRLRRRTSSKSNGLPRKSAAPRDRARLRVSRLGSAVRTTTGR